LGTDPNDFGLALVESFSYMGDLVNYYIDRIANESFILTATQRESLLNIASMYGYKPAHYVSAATTLDITDSKSGYLGQIGGAIIETGTVNGVVGNYAKVIVPNGHPFTVAGATHTINVSSMPSYSPPSVIADQTLTYNTSVFNGVFPVAYVGYEHIGQNVVWYRPSATVSNAVVMTAPITSALVSGTNLSVTYQAANLFNVNDKVNITGLTTTSGMSLNLTAAVVTASTATQFTVSPVLPAVATVTGVTAGTGSPTPVGTVRYTAANAFTVGQYVTVTGITGATGYNVLVAAAVTAATSTYFEVANATTGGSPVFSGVVATPYIVGVASGTGTATLPTSFVVTLNDVSPIAPTAVVTAASAGTTGIITYTANNTFVPGQSVYITGLSTIAFNLGSSTVPVIVNSIVYTSGTATGFTVLNAATGTAVTGASASAVVVPANRTITPIAGQKIFLHNVNVASGSNYNGKWVVTNFVPSTSSSTLTSTVAVSTLAADTVADPTSAKIVGTNVYYSTWSDFVVGQTVTITGATTPAFNLANVVVNAVNDIEAAVSRTAYTTGLSGALGTITYTTSLPFSVGDYITTRGIASPSNTIGARDLGYNFTNQTVTAVGTIPASVNAVVPSYPSSGNITYQTGAAHGFLVNDYVTITGVANLVTGDVTQTNVYNLTAAKITAVTSNTFTVSGYWVNPFDNANSGLGQAVLNTVTIAANVSESASSVGSAFSEYFSVPKGSLVQPTATPLGATSNGTLVTYTGTGITLTLGQVVNITGYPVGVTSPYNLSNVTILSAVGTAGAYTSFTVSAPWVPSSTPAGTGGTATVVGTPFTGATGPLFVTGAGTATVQIGGTWATSPNAEVVYANIPTLVVSGPTVSSVGGTVVPKGTQVSTQVTVNGSTQVVYFSTQADLVVPFRQTASVLALQNEDVSLRAANLANTALVAYDINGELLGSSNGTADQKFPLKEVKVNPAYVRVFVDSGTAWEEWTKQDFIQDFGPLNKIFSVSIAADETVRVMFGDGISGLIPPNNAQIKAVYYAGGGIQGNVAANTLTNWAGVSGVNTAAITAMTVNNAVPATGGADPESNDSIRYNAPRSLRALNRAVTLDDFANLALATSGVVKAKAIAASRSSVTVYIAPTNDGLGTPGVGTDLNDTPAMTDSISLVTSYLSDKTQIGTAVTVLSPMYTQIFASVNYSPLPQYNQALVEADLQQALLNNFSYENSDFGDVITPEEMEFKLRSVPGVLNAKVTALYRSGGSGRNSLIGDPSELFVLNQNPVSPALKSITLSAMDSIATVVANGVTFAPLTSLGVSSGTATITPAVNPGVYSYNVSFPVLTASFKATVTPTANSMSVVTSTVTVADAALSTTYPATSPSAVPVVTGSTVLVNVTAQDGFTMNTYRFNVVIAAS
jgi:hypothetical protein